MSARNHNSGNYSPSLPVGLHAKVPEGMAGMRIDLVLARVFPDLSRSRLQDWVKQGWVMVDGVPVNSKHKAWGGESISLSPEQTVAPTCDVAEKIALNIVYEDEHLIVLNKPVGLVVHPGNGNRTGTLLNALLNHAPELSGLSRAGIVHRLDKDTSGLMVVAKNTIAQLALVRQLQTRTVSRQYLALVHGKVESVGNVDAPIGRHPTQRTRMAVNPHGRNARTFYMPVERFSVTTLIECKLETGRTHQIRVHMASIGHPLVGDKTYGRRKSGSDNLDAFPRQALHAWRLGLIHPFTGHQCRWESSLPADLAEFLDLLRQEGA
jgi:23S rRNA pseudouridine1911/1915/1917 synthase